VVTAAADAWADKAGGTSGALWGLGLRRIGVELGDSEAPTPSALAAGLHAARTAVTEFGRAEVGDKTLVDVLVPFEEAFSAAVAAGHPAVEAWLQSATVAERAVDGTKDLLPRMGRARPHAERSLGTPDPGAVSLALIVRAVADRLSASPAGTPREDALSSGVHA
jgi:dihydroxyacetone kinase